MIVGVSFVLLDLVHPSADAFREVLFFDGFGFNDGMLFLNCLRDRDECDVNVNNLKFGGFDNVD